MHSLSARLVAAFMLLSVLALAVALVATQRAVEKAAEEKIRGDLTRTLNAFQRLSQATQESILAVADAHARDRTFKNAALTVNSDDSTAGLDDGDAEFEGIQNAHDVILSADTEVFGWKKDPEKKDPERTLWAFFNVRKRLVFTHGDDEQVGNTVDDVPLLDRALHEGFASELWSPAYLRTLPFTFVPPCTGDNAKICIREDDLLLVHAHLATTSGGENFLEQSARRPIGVVLKGRWVTELLLENSLEQGTSGAELQGAGAHFALRAGDALTTSKGVSRELRAKLVESGSAATQPEEATQKNPDESFSLDTNDGRYLVREDVFWDVHGEKRKDGREGTAIGRVFVMRNLDAESEPILTGVRTRLLPIAVGVVLLAFVLAVLLARRLSAPLVQLEAAARQVRLGALDVEVPVRGTDEVGRLTGAFNEMVLGLRQRDQIHGLFKRYLNPQVVDELIRNPEKAAPGGERRELTVLFSDLVGFTSMSEEMSPEALVDVLNGYFERATEVLGEHGATLDKFIGDAIMCFWNAPLPQEDHAARACLTALRLVAVVDTLAPKLEARGLARLDCRIGLNTGPGVVGNIGSRAAQDYTVIGDTVNLASRLEGAAKVYGTRILASEETVRAARGTVLARELDLLRVKGRQLPVRVYELVDVAGAPPPAHLARFAEGLALYRARRFTEALEHFRASPGDPPSRVFAARCEASLRQPPPEDWDGVFSLDTK
ncbi:MAG TPA: adenylate/guanylate cyclase domain-containing protein [Archangium sp.]|uniref:adenylate/guanylate cyclase domain-containing protein n=1 Tax=Archangium sp. TaxID=1872627 RepID=UPI002E31F688|nr:adenylate/guanylate cyclase domain-containing protein [Archangium sp.]HEX5752799.1 adenylate/guanylate cyclase domain-containing protein [Archangium sp.]